MVDRAEPLAAWEKELLGNTRPERADRPRRAPRAGAKTSDPSAPRKQCSSWGTFEEQPYRCDRAPHGPNVKHRAFIDFEYDRYPEVIQW